jgi:hypothetical protein
MLKRLVSQKRNGVSAAHRYDSTNASVTGAPATSGWSPRPRGSNSPLAAVNNARKVQNAKIPSSSERRSGM